MSRLLLGMEIAYKHNNSNLRVHTPMDLSTAQTGESRTLLKPFAAEKAFVIQKTIDSMHTYTVSHMHRLMILRSAQSDENYTLPSTPFTQRRLVC